MSLTTVNDCKFIDLRKISDPRGNLTVIEGNGDIPFDIKRVYYLYDVPGGESRGAHAHKQLYQLIVAASGSFTVTLDDGKEKKSFNLKRSYYGLLVVPGIWRDLDDFSSGSVLLCLASEHYQEEDYIREYQEFLEYEKMIKLPADFTYTNYGIKARLVTEAEAEFIVQLRSNDRLGRFIHASDGSVEKQIEWTQEYKKREAAGLDYYFIFSKENEDFGLCRIYNIDWTHLSYTSGSWVMKPGLPIDISMIPSVMIGDIANDMLGLLVDIYDVRKGNKQVLRYHRKILCAYEFGETEMDVLFMSTPETRKQSKLRRLLRLPPFEKNQYKL